MSPFFGSGAIEREVLGAGLFSEVLAYDNCKELRCFYSAVRQGPARVLAALRRLCAKPESFTTARYTTLRSENGRGQAYGAARFLYLQGYSFRGLWRVNRAGRHNTPPDQARLSSFRFDLEPGGEMETELLSLSKLLRTKLEWSSSWTSCIRDSSPGDLIVADPPYLKTFGSYSPTRFGPTDHAALALALQYAATLGRRVLAFNSPTAAPLYKGWSTRLNKSRPSRMVSTAGLREEDCLFVAGFTPTEERLFFAAHGPDSGHTKARKGPTSTEAA